MNFSYALLLSAFTRGIKTFLFLGILFAAIASLVYSLAQNEDGRFESSSRFTTLRVDALMPNSARELVGLWEAKRRFGPDIRGILLIKESSSGWWAEIAGKIVQAKLDGDAITFELPDSENSFKGKFEARRTKIVGHWIQPTNYASPVVLTKYGNDVWRGNVLPYDDTFTLYLMVRARDDGSV
ncbi:MAG: hypothetical protein HY277_07805, partial [Ignavibacteriales bacterium]|nr:hypothetical protein [Ignavibacteriales bacterium]